MYLLKIALYRRMFLSQKQIVRDNEFFVIKESQFAHYYTEDMRGFKIWFVSCWSGSVRRGPRQTGRLGILMNPAWRFQNEWFTLYSARRSEYLLLFFFCFFDFWRFDLIGGPYAAFVIHSVCTYISIVNLLC